MQEQSSDAEEVRILDFWREGEVWFRDFIPSNRPWSDESLLEKIPEEAAGAYGAKTGGRATVDGQSYDSGELVVVENREQLRQLTAGLGAIEGILFPWYERIVPPSLWLPYRRRISRDERKQEIGPAWSKALLITCIGVGVIYAYPQYLMLALIGATYYGLFPLVRYSMEWLRRVERLSVEELNLRLVNGELFRRWILKRSTLPLKVAIGILILVFLGQLLVDKDADMRSYAPSIQAAALMRAEVLGNGEWWRVITTGLMHGSILHILFNGMALFSLGRVVAALVSPALLSVVFLVTVITGSLASLYIGHGAASVGASGGILGCLGFLLVVTWRFREEIPSYLSASLVQSTIVISIFGFLGSAFIDNAAHAGGFLGGLAIGICLFPRLRLAPQKRGLTVRIAGWVSNLILLGGVAKVGWELWKVASF